MSNDQLILSQNLTSSLAERGSKARYVTGSGSDKTIYQQQTGIKLVYDRSLNTIVIENDTANDIRIDFNIDFEVNPDHSSAPLLYKAVSKSILVPSLDASYLSSSAVPFSYGSVVNDTRVAFSDEDLVNWTINKFVTFQYDGLYADDTDIISEDHFNMTITGLVDYALTNNYVYVDWDSQGISEY